MTKKPVTKPLPEKQEVKLADLMNNLSATRGIADSLRDVLANQKDELDNCKRLLGRLSGVIGTDSYEYASSSPKAWREIIATRMAAIDKIIA